MNEKILVVGIGPGNRNYILPAALEALSNSDYILGFARAIESLSFLENKFVVVNSLKEIVEFINKNSGCISVASSGDPCFYGVLEYLKNNLKEDISVIPGLSSFQYLTAKLKKSWSEAFLGSMHGRESDFLKHVMGNKISIWLTDKESSPNSLCEKLIENKIRGRVYVGENLSYEDERIVEGKPEEIILNKYNSLSIFIFERID